MSEYMKFNLKVSLATILLIITIIIYLAYPRPDNTLYNNQVRKIAHVLLTQCIPDYRARKIPVIVCYRLHARFIHNNLR